MKGKITTIIGILIILLAAIAYILFESHVKDTSNITAVNVVVAKQEIPCDTIIHNLDEAQKYFTVKRISQTDAVTGAVVVASDIETNDSFFTKILNYFKPKKVDESQVGKLVGLKVTRNYVKNEQILSGYFSSDITSFKEEERIYSPSNSSKFSVTPAMATQLHQGDYVDLWIVTKDLITKEVTANKFYGPLNIYLLMDNEGNILRDGATSSSVNLTFKLSNKDIAIIESRLAQDDVSSMFITKYGATPTAEQLASVYDETKNVTPNDTINKQNYENNEEIVTQTIEQELETNDAKETDTTNENVSTSEQ